MSTKTDKLRIQVARDLREIKRLYGHLSAQAYYAATGHDAANLDPINLLGPVANATQWERTYEEAVAKHAALVEAGHLAGKFPDYVIDQVGELHPLFVLSYWEDIIRGMLGTPTNKQATVIDAANYLASAINWMFDTNASGRINFLPVDQLLRDLHRCRTNLENVLKDGIRHERTETPCEKDGCDNLLVKIYGGSAATDRFECPSCKRPIDYPKYVGIRQRHMWSERADNAWIDISAASKSINRSQWTIRQWMKPAPETKVPFHGRKVRSRRVGPMRRIEVYWPDVRDADSEAKRRDVRRRADIA